MDANELVPENIVKIVLEVGATDRSQILKGIMELLRNRGLRFYQAAALLDYAKALLQAEKF